MKSILLKKKNRTLDDVKVKIIFFVVVKAGKQILIAAHGNSLRGIVKHLDNMSEEAIMELNLPTGDHSLK